MYQERDDTAENRRANKVKKKKMKRKLSKDNHHRGHHHHPSQSTSSDPGIGRRAGVELQFSKSLKSTESFDEIFAEAQAAVREHTSSFNLGNCDDEDEEELPSIGGSSREPSPVDLRPRTKIPKLKKKNKKKKKKMSKKTRNGACCTVTLAHEQPHCSTNGLSTTSQLSKSYFSVANMETSTELNSQCDAGASDRLKPRVEDIITLSSDEEQPARNNFSFHNSVPTTSRRWRKKSSYPQTLRSVSPEPLIVSLSRSSRPERAPEDKQEKLPLRVRIQYRNELFEFDGNENWDIERVKEKLSELSHIPENELIIYNESEQKMVDGKTLKDYNINTGEVLEALRRDTGEIFSAPDSSAMITLKFQKEGLKRPLSLNVSKYSSLKEIRTRVAKEILVEEKTLVFRIDGENLDLVKTPDELDLEDDICVDIHEKH